MSSSERASSPLSEESVSVSSEVSDPSRPPSRGARSDNLPNVDEFSPPPVPDLPDTGVEDSDDGGSTSPSPTQSFNPLTDGPQTRMDRAESSMSAFDINTPAPPAPVAQSARAAGGGDAKMDAGAKERAEKSTPNEMVAGEDTKVVVTSPQATESPGSPSLGFNPTSAAAAAAALPPGSEQASMAKILACACEPFWEQVEVQIAKNFSEAERTRVELASYAPCVAQMEDAALPGIRKALRELKRPMRKESRKADGGSRARAECEVRIQDAKRLASWRPYTPLKSRGNGLMLQCLSHFFYILYLDSRYLARLCRSAGGGGPKNESDPLDIVCNVMYREHWSGFKNESFLALLGRALDDEMASCIDVSSYLRGACPPIQMLTAYLSQSDCKRVLTETLPEDYIIETISGKELNIKPIHIVMELAAKGVAGIDATSPEVEEIRRQRLKPLTQVCNAFLDRILACRITPGMRAICAHLARVAEAKCPGDQKVADGLVGGFLFLRFFNPHILAAASGRQKQVRDSLITVTRILQKLSNHVLFQKEKYMKPLNPFLTSKFTQIREFFARISGRSSGAGTSSCVPQLNIRRKMGMDSSCVLFATTRDAGELYSLLQKRSASLKTDLNLNSSDPLLKIMSFMRTCGVGERLERWADLSEVENGISLEVRSRIIPGLADAETTSRRRSDSLEGATPRQDLMQFSVHDNRALIPAQKPTPPAGFLGTATDEQELKDLLACAAPAGISFFTWFKPSPSINERGTKVYAWPAQSVATWGSQNADEWVECEGVLSGKIVKTDLQIGNAGTEALLAKLTPFLTKTLRSLRHPDPGADTKRLRESVAAAARGDIGLIALCDQVDAAVTDASLKSSVRGVVSSAKALQAETPVKDAEEGASGGDMKSSSASSRSRLVTALAKIATDLTERSKLHTCLAADATHMQRAKTDLVMRMAACKKDLMACEHEFLSLQTDRQKRLTTAAEVDAGFEFKMGEKQLAGGLQMSLKVSLEEIIGGLLNKFMADVAHAFAERLQARKDSDPSRGRISICDILFPKLANAGVAEEAEWRANTVLAFPRDCDFYQSTMDTFATLCDCCVDLTVLQVIESLPSDPTQMVANATASDQAGDRKGEANARDDVRFSWDRMVRLLSGLRPTSEDTASLDAEVIFCIVNIMATDVLLAALQHFDPHAGAAVAGRLSKGSYKLLLSKIIPNFGLPEGKFPPSLREVRNYIGSQWALVLGNVCPYAAIDACSLLSSALKPLVRYQKDASSRPLSFRVTLRGLSPSGDHKQAMGGGGSTVSDASYITGEELIYFLHSIWFLQFDESTRGHVRNAKELLQILIGLVKNPIRLPSKLSKEQQTLLRTKLLISIEHMLRGTHFSATLCSAPRGVHSTYIKPLYRWLLTFEKGARSDAVSTAAKRLAATILLRSEQAAFRSSNITEFMGKHLLKRIVKTNKIKAEHLAVLLHFLRGGAGERYYGMPWMQYICRQKLPAGFQRFGRILYKLDTSVLEMIAAKIFSPDGRKKIGNEPELTTLSERIVVQMACHDAKYVKKLLLGALLQWNASARNWPRQFENRHLLSMRCLECLTMEKSDFASFYAENAANNERRDGGATGGDDPGSRESRQRQLKRELDTLFVHDTQIKAAFRELMSRAEQTVGLSASQPHYASDSGKRSGYPGRQSEGDFVSFNRLSGLVLPALDRNAYAVTSTRWRIQAEKAKKPGLAHYVYFYLLRLTPKIFHQSFFIPEKYNCIRLDSKTADPPMFPGRLVVHGEQMFSVTAQQALFTIMSGARGPAMRPFIVRCSIQVLNDAKLQQPVLLCRLLRLLKDLLVMWTNILAGDRTDERQFDRLLSTDLGTAAADLATKGGQGGAPPAARVQIDNPDSLIAHCKYLDWYRKADAVALAYLAHPNEGVRHCARMVQTQIQKLIFSAIERHDLAVAQGTMLCVEDVRDYHQADIQEVAVAQGRSKRLADYPLTVDPSTADPAWMLSIWSLGRTVVNCGLIHIAHTAIEFLNEQYCAMPGRTLSGPSAKCFRPAFGLMFSLLGDALLDPYKRGARSGADDQRAPQLTQAQETKARQLRDDIKDVLHRFWEIVLHEKAGESSQNIPHLAGSALFECHPKSMLPVLRNLLRYYHGLAKAAKRRSKIALAILTRLMHQLTSCALFEEALVLPRTGDHIVRHLLTFIQSTRVQLWSKDKLSKHKWFDTQASLVCMVGSLCGALANTFQRRYPESCVVEGRELKRPNAPTPPQFENILPLQTSGRESAFQDAREIPLSRWALFKWLVGFAKQMDESQRGAAAERKTTNDDAVAQLRRHEIDIKAKCLWALQRLASLGPCIDNPAFIMSQSLFFWMTDEEETKGWEPRGTVVSHSWNDANKKLHPNQMVEINLDQHIVVAGHKTSRYTQFSFRLALWHKSHEIWFKSIPASDADKPARFVAPEKPGEYRLELMLLRADALGDSNTQLTSARESTAIGSASTLATSLLDQASITTLGSSKVKNLSVREVWRVPKFFKFSVCMPSAHVLPALLLFFEPRVLSQYLDEAISSNSRSARLCARAIKQVYTTDTKTLSLLPQGPEISEMVGLARFAYWSRSGISRDCLEKDLDKMLFLALYELASPDRYTRFLAFQMLTSVIGDLGLLSFDERLQLKRFSFAFEADIITSAKAHAVKISQMLAKSMGFVAERLIAQGFKALKNCVSHKLHRPEWIMTFLHPWARAMDLSAPREADPQAPGVAIVADSKRGLLKSTPRLRMTISSPRATSSDQKSSPDPSSEAPSPKPSPPKPSPPKPSPPKLAAISGTSTSAADATTTPAVSLQRQNMLLYDLFNFLKISRLRDAMLNFLVALAKNEENTVTIIAYMLGKIDEVMTREREELASATRGGMEFATKGEIEENTRVIHNSIVAIFTRCPKIRAFTLELLFQYMRRHLTQDFNANSSKTATIRRLSPVLNIGNLQRTRLSYSLHSMLRKRLLDMSLGEEKSAPSDERLRKIMQRQHMLVCNTVVDFIGIDREVVRHRLPEMVVYAMLLLSNRSSSRREHAPVRDVMIKLLVRLLSAFESTHSEELQSKARRATDELEEVVNRFIGAVEGGGAPDYRGLTASILAIFRVECPISVPQIGRTAFRWGVLALDDKITRKAFAAYECLLDPIDAKVTMGGAGAAFNSKTQSLIAVAAPDSALGAGRAAAVADGIVAKTELVGMETRVALHTLLVKLNEILMLVDQNQYSAKTVKKYYRIAYAVLDMMRKVAARLASINRLQNHPALLWTAVGLLRCPDEGVYRHALGILSEVRSYDFLFDGDRAAPAGFWTYASRWTPRFAGVLTYLIPGLMNEGCEAPARRLAFALLNSTDESMVGFDAGSPVRHVVAILMFLPWLHRSMCRDARTIGRSDEERELAVPAVLRVLAAVVTPSSRELAATLQRHAEASEDKEQEEASGDAFLKEVCLGVVRVFFPKYALLCARYLMKIIQSQYHKYYASTLAIVGNMITAPNAPSFITAFSPIIDMAQRLVMEKVSRRKPFGAKRKPQGSGSAAAASRIIRAVMQVLLVKQKKNKGNDKSTGEAEYQNIDVIPIRDRASVMSALQRVLKATPSV